MEKKCVICGQNKLENIEIMGKAICADCEWKLVVTRVHDEGYRDYVLAVQKAFLRKNNKGA